MPARPGPMGPEPQRFALPAPDERPLTDRVPAGRPDAGARPRAHATEHARPETAPERAGPVEERDAGPRAAGLPDRAAKAADTPALRGGCETEAGHDGEDQQAADTATILAAAAPPPLPSTQPETSVAADADLNGATGRKDAAAGEASPTADSPIGAVSAEGIAVGGGDRVGPVQHEAAHGMPASVAAKGAEPDAIPPPHPAMASLSSPDTMSAQPAAPAAGDGGVRPAARAAESGTDASIDRGPAPEARDGAQGDARLDDARLGDPKPGEARPVDGKGPDPLAALKPAADAVAPRLDLERQPGSAGGLRESDRAPADAMRVALPEPAGRPLPPSAVPVEIGLRALQGLKEFQIRLDPAELGRVEIRLSIDEDGTVTARVVVDRVETLNLLQRDAKTLERAFEQAGLKSADGGIDMTLRDPGQHNRDRGREAWDGEGAFSTRGPDAKPDIDPVIRRVLHRGALDLTI